MSKEIYSFNVRDAIQSFEQFPKIFKILWSVKRVYLISILALSILSGLMPTISILTTQFLLNAIQTSSGNDFSYVLYPVIIYLVANSMGYVISLMNGFLQSIYRLDLNYKISLLILDKAKMLNLSDFENADVYDKLRRAQNESIERPYAVFTIILGLISQFVALVSALTILLYWKPWVAFLIIIVPIISTVYMAKISYEKHLIEYKRSSEKRKSWYLSYLMTNDIAFKEIRLYQLGTYFIESYRKLYEGFIKQDKKIIKKQTITSSTFQVVDQLVGGGILIIIAKAAYSGEILLGSTVAYIRSISNVSGSMQGLLGALATLYQNNLYIKQLFDFLEMEVHQGEELKDYVLIDEIESIEFKNVSFKYPNRKDYALTNLSFKIHKGEKISFVGENGSGKTTLIKLMAGFYYTYEGEILINGISSKNINHESLNKKIGVIFQDFNKYEFSCRQNIALGNLDWINRDDLLKEAINKAHADDFVNNLPSGIDTQLGVWFGGGVQLSGGQWQKIALSRAFLRDADCYILDEPSASLDPVSEDEIFKKTSELTNTKIAIFISHRLYNLKRISSRILVLKNGRLIEEGDHESLMHLNGHYKYLYNIQNNMSNKNIEELTA